MVDTSCSVSQSLAFPVVNGICEVTVSHSRHSADSPYRQVSTVLQLSVTSLHLRPIRPLQRIRRAVQVSTRLGRDRLLDSACVLFILCLPIHRPTTRVPECDSLADGEHRTLRGDRPCECKDGWDGINCNGVSSTPVQLNSLASTHLRPL